MSIWFS